MISDSKKEVENIPECSICLDSEPSEKALWWKGSCRHTFHLECLKGLINEKCPICRAILTSLPSDIEEHIKENIKKYNREIEIENLEASFSYVTVNMEADLAFSTLVNVFQIPENLIPNVHIPVGIDTPMPPGTIYKTILVSALEFLKNELVTDEVEDKDV